MCVFRFNPHWFHVLFHITWHNALHCSINHTVRSFSWLNIDQTFPITNIFGQQQQKETAKAQKVCCENKNCLGKTNNIHDVQLQPPLAHVTKPPSQTKVVFITAGKGNTKKRSNQCSIDTCVQASVWWRSFPPSSYTTGGWWVNWYDRRQRWCRRRIGNWYE